MHNVKDGVVIECQRSGSEQLGLKNNIKYTIGDPIIYGIEVSSDCELLNSKSLPIISNIISTNKKKDPDIRFAITKGINYFESADTTRTNNIIKMRKRIFIIIIGDIDLASKFSNNVKDDIKKQFYELDVKVTFKGNLDLSCRYISECFAYGIREFQLDENGR